jgi:hypothetical protein
MPIPPFDSNLVLPPHLGNPADLTQVSPYRTSIDEVCGLFATSQERISILTGLLELRNILATGEMTQGFQLLNGSFLQDIEALENRPPKDIDVVTFFWDFNVPQMTRLKQSNPDISDPKQHYKVDHYFVDAEFSPTNTIEMSQYWYGLFSHRRDHVWKGMLRIELDTPAEDAQAAAILQHAAALGGVNP